MPPPNSALSLAGGIGAAADRPPSADGTNPLEATPMTTPLNIRRAFAAGSRPPAWPQPAVSQLRAAVRTTSRYQAGAASYYTQAGGPVVLPPGTHLQRLCPPDRRTPAPCCTYAGATAPPPAWSTTAARLLVDASSICSHSSSVSSGPSPPGCSVASKFATEQHRSRPFVGQHR
jgi:hypothetical protein